MSRSSRGLGHHPFTVTTPVRIWYGTPLINHMANITLQLDISLVRQLKYIAKQRKMTLSELVTEILKLKLQELEDDRPF